MSTVVAGSAYRALAWQRPKGRRFIEPIERAIALVGDALAGTESVIYQALFAASPLFRAGGAERRTRKMRSDGEINMAALLQALLASADLCSGMLAAPRGDGPWQKHEWGRLDWRAYGGIVPRERSFRRCQRHARELAALGMIEVHEIHATNARGQVRSEIAFKRVTMKLFELLGLGSAVKRARRERDRKKGEDAATRVATRQRSRKTPERAAPVAPTPPVAAFPPRPPPGPPRDPDKPEPAGMTEIRKLLDC